MFRGGNRNMFLFPGTPIGNRILFPLLLQPFLHTLMLTDIDYDFFIMIFVMSPQKNKTNNDSGLPTDYAAMPPNHGVISTDTNNHKDPFTIPDVKTIEILMHDFSSTR
jgi:hypothetical protein